MAVLEAFGVSVLTGVLTAFFAIVVLPQAFVRETRIGPEGVLHRGPAGNTIAGSYSEISRVVVVPRRIRIAFQNGRSFDILQFQGDLEAAERTLRRYVRTEAWVSKSTHSEQQC